MVLAKIIGFVISLFVANALTKPEYGFYTYAFTIISFMLPFIGFGGYQSLIYFGAELKTEEEKQALFSYAFKRGIGLSAVMAAVVILFSSLITKNLPESQFLLILLSLHLVTFTLVNYVRNYTRLIGRNDIFGKSELVYSIVLLVLVIAGVLSVKETGYAAAMALTPLLVGLFYYKKIGVGSFKASKPASLDAKAFWKYGVFVSLGAVAAQLLYAVDIMTIGNFLPLEFLTGGDSVESKIAIYKVCSIIPLAAFVLPLAIVTTDFVHIAEQKTDAVFLKSYAKSLMKILIPAGIVVAAILHFGATYFLALFDLMAEVPKYAGNENLISIFALGVIGAFIFRVPFGNLLSAVGKADWNSYISFAMLAINILLNYVLVKSYGITGAAWATTIIIWVSGVVSMMAFNFFLRRIKK